jgi:phosphoadenosine phosphosulfate reductase
MMQGATSSLTDRPAGKTTRLPSAIEQNARPSPAFEAKLAATRRLLIQTAAEYANPEGLSGLGHSLVSQANSLGAEDMVVSHLINSLQLDVSIFVLETGMLHPETLQVLEQLKATSRAPVTAFKPVQEAVVQFVAREGKDAMYRSIELRKACCGIRKMEPLERALAGKKAWITGLRREQSGARADVPLRDESDTQRIKFNPLADWTWGDVWHYIHQNDVAYNPLHDQFFPSIGCAPCTRAIALGEDFRAGRWWWEDEAAKECGLHAKDTQQDTPQSTPQEATA